MKCGEVIGVGFTATVYEWGEGRVLKLFNRDFPRSAIEKEFHNALAIGDLNFPKPKAYEMISYENRIGIVYDRLEGESLLDWVLRTNDLQKCAEYMAKLHKTILNNTVSNIPNYKDFLRYFISLSADPVEREEAMSLLNHLPDGNSLCHGDYHPGNILISDGQTMAIDFMNLCHGDNLYDVARTVYLVEYTPAPANADNLDMILYFKKTLADLYLQEMNVTREMIQDYISVIKIARKYECPNE